MSKIDELLSKGKLKKFKTSSVMVNKEFEMGKNFIAEAEKLFNLEFYRIATSQAYYAIFHAVRALVFKEGYREESHIALKHAFSELFIQTKRIDSKVLDTFENGMIARQAADYKGYFSKEKTSELIKAVKEQINEIEKHLI